MSGDEQKPVRKTHPTFNAHIASCHAMYDKTADVVAFGNAMAEYDGPVFEGDDANQCLNCGDPIPYDKLHCDPDCSDSIPAESYDLKARIKELEDVLRQIKGLQEDMYRRSFKSHEIWNLANEALGGTNDL